MSRKIATVTARTAERLSKIGAELAALSTRLSTAGMERLSGEILSASEACKNASTDVLERLK